MNVNVLEFKMVFMKLVVMLFASFFPLNCLAHITQHFEGQRFVAKVTNNCPEGYVTCEDVIFSSKNKKTGKGIILKGRTVNLNCPEVCNFRGYEFKNGIYTYSLLTNDFQRWDLNVFKMDKVISSDFGTMK
jgi:hypothetical protein